MPRWLIDPDHSVASFAVRHMMVADVRGQFNRIAGELEYSPDAPGSTTLELTIEVEGAYTGIARRDSHLKSSDFFDLGRFPHIVFRSHAAETAEGELRRIRGDLTLHGVTRALSMEAVLLGPATAEDGDTCLGLQLSTLLDREEYAMSWNVPIVGGVMVSREVRVVVDIEADLAEV